jgi:hypothetical protein
MKQNVRQNRGKREWLFELSLKPHPKAQRPIAGWWRPLGITIGARLAVELDRSSIGTSSSDQH